MRRIKKHIVAWTGYFKKDHNGKVILRQDDIFSSIELIHKTFPNYQIVIIDWHSISRENFATVCDVYTKKIYNINLFSIDIVHFLKLGYGSNKRFSLKEKWEELKNVLEIFDILQIKTINPIETIRYGISKHYLIDLQSKNIPIPDTKIISSNMCYSEFKQLALTPTDVVKPINGECGHLVKLYRDINEGIYEQYSRHCEEILIQKFVPEIIFGEKSLVFCENSFLFAFKKIPSDNGFKTNGPHVGALVEPYLPQKNEVEFCHHVIKHYEKPLWVYRLDIISTTSKIILMELEVVDPGFYIGNKIILLKAFQKLYSSLLYE